MICLLETWVRVVNYSFYERKSKIIKSMCFVTYNLVFANGVS
jgi:hypothetical protein